VDNNNEHEASYQEKIWHVVSMIPKGKVATYGQVAELAGLPRMARAVGRTLSKLPKGTELPWFRVINAKGMISFPVDSEAYLRQKDLLAEEGITLLNGKINLKIHRWIP
jgi:methylated-DNA-protein-cysteine methyltransferase-like protein